MLPADTPQLPKWPFLVGDAALLALAWLIGDQSRNPFAGTPLIAIVVCVICGAILGAIPFLADYARKQDEALDERQRALEALSRTVAASAEQISIAANGLHEIAEVAQRNLKAAEQLPGKLQEKISAIKIQSEAPREARETRDHEKEELKKEVARLRTADTERLQAATDQLFKATAELAKLAATRPEPVRGPSELARAAPTEALPPEPPPAAEVAATPPSPSQEAAPAADRAIPAGHEAPPPPKRVRKPKPEASVPAPAPAPAPEANATPAPEVPPAPPAEAEPAPIPVAEIPEVVPVAPDSRAPIELLPPAESPMPEANSAAAPAEAATPEPAPVSAAAPSAEAAKPERKRAPRKPKVEAPAPAPATETTTGKSDDEPTLNLNESAAEPESTTAAAPAEKGERSVSSDGATRLLVTAYIGIGNRLFIRGSGPGLSWDKGLPLQFVSIGKWRWETSDATAPVQFKLYKNDDSECASLGTQTLDPGQQEEVTASF